MLASREIKSFHSTNFGPIIDRRNERFNGAVLITSAKAECLFRTTLKHGKARKNRVKKNQSPTIGVIFTFPCAKFSLKPILHIFPIRISEFSIVYGDS